MTDQASILKHPSIGPIRGIRKLPGVTQYLGVQYGLLQDRFSRGELLESYPSDHSRVRDGVFDATRTSYVSSFSSIWLPLLIHVSRPVPLSPAAGCQWEQTLIQQSLPFQTFEQSDTECLTVNIAVPDLNPDDGGASSAWPVLALVHGGAFVTGSSSYPQYDLARIVQISVEMGQPMVAVGIK